MYSYNHAAALFNHAGPHAGAPALSSVPSVGTHFRSKDVVLHLRQQPKEALVCSDGKEKTRKPVDPPPIIQLTVEQAVDPHQHFLQSPYLFMCVSLYKPDKEEPWDEHANKSLAGSLASSLHRLKDVDNKECGFFVFGDVSVKVTGTFRLHFSLFELQKDTNNAQFLASALSETFKVVLPKDFKGMEESTYLSRAFSDQGVRLRLRKEPRAMLGSKRAYPYSVDQPGSNAPLRPSVNEYSSYGDNSSPPNKRFRSDSDEIKREPYAESTALSGADFPPSTAYSHSYPSSHSGSHFQSRQSAMSAGYGMTRPQTTLGSSYSAPAIQTALTSSYSMPALSSTTAGSSFNLPGIQATSSSSSYTTPEAQSTAPAGYGSLSTPYPTFGAHSSADSTPYPFQPSLGGSFPPFRAMNSMSSWGSDSLLQTTSNEGTLSAQQQHYPDLGHRW